MKNTAKTSHKCTSHKLLCALVLLCSCALVQAKVLPKTARLVPPETVLLVDIDDFGRLKAQFEKTNLYKLYKDPAMAAFIGDFKAKWREKIQELGDNDIAEVIINTGVLPQGRVAGALVLNKQAVDVKEPMALFITQWGESIFKIKEAVDKTAQKAVEDGAHLKNEDYRGVSIKTIIGADSSRLGYGFSSTLSYCFIDDYLVGSEDIELLKYAIAHIKGASSPTLADDSDYNSTMKTLGPYHDIDFYVNIKQFIKTLITEDAAGGAQTIITNLGFDNVAAFGVSIGLAQDAGSSYCGKAFLKIEGGKKGICKMLEPESAVLSIPRFIPSSAYSMSFFNLNIKKAYSELANILNSFSPQAAAWMYMPLPTSSAPDEPGLKIKDDIIDHLGSQIMIAQSINKPFSKSSMAEYLVILAAANPRALEKSMSLLHSKIIAPNNPDARRELLGHTIYLITMPAFPFFPTGITPMQAATDSDVPQVPKLAFTITDTHLIFGVESTVEQAIRSLSSAEAVSAGSAKWFTSAKSAIPSVVGVASLQNDAASSELFWWMMKQSSKVEDSTVPNPLDAAMFGPMAFKQLVNTGLLPEFDAVRKYFGVSVSYGISRQDGFFFEFRDINPGGTD